MATTDKTTTKGDANLAEIEGNGYDEAEAFDNAMRAMIPLIAERQALNARITKARKGFKADGIALGHLDAAIKMLEWSASEVREHFATAQRYARLAGLPVGEQVDMFAHADDDAVAKADWISRGYSDAMLGKPPLIPEGCPPESHNDYLHGHSGARWWTEGDSSKDIH